MSHLIDTPAPGDGITVCGWTDRMAYTVQTVSASGHKFIARRDRAERTNRGADTFAPGGFMGHTSHPDGQGWTYSANPDGHLVTVTRRRDGRYRVSGTSASVLAGRHEHFDYNF